jgi:NUMOD1 domain
MHSLLHSQENEEMNPKSIRNAIESSRIYKKFRWDYVGENNKKNNKNITKEKILEPILKLNNTKTEIIETYSSKTKVSRTLNISLPKIRKIIENKTLYNNNYYIEFDDCPKNLLGEYKKPINKFTPSNAKKIKQINAVSKEVMIFNSISDANSKLGTNHFGIVTAIKDKTVYNGSLWEYCK